MLEYQNKFLIKLEPGGAAHGKATMGFRRSDLREAFAGAGTHGFRVWGYSTTDPLDEVLAESYFRHGNGLLRQGELIYVSIAPARERPGMSAVNAMRMALVMVRRSAPGTASVRLVQDFGEPDDPSAPAAAQPPVASVKRGRGRPPAREPDKETGVTCFGTGQLFEKSRISGDFSGHRREISSDRQTHRMRHHASFA